MYAIVGTSGAGKSTIIGMIPRLYDVSRGSVKIAGTDVQKFSLAYLRQNIGIVTQDTYLLTALFLKICFMQARCHARRLKTPAGRLIFTILFYRCPKFDTVVGNRGLKLSGGEKQRVSIARVILKNSQNTYFGRSYLRSIRYQVTLYSRRFRL